MGSQEIFFEPKAIRGGEHHFDIGTAGAVSLVLQALLPVALMSHEPTRITISGGTDVSRAPPWDYMTHVFLPMISAMGAKVRAACLRRGYFPRGGGLVQADISFSCLSPLHLPATRVLAAEGIVCTARLPDHVARRLAESAAEALFPLEVHMEQKKEEALSPGGSLVLWGKNEGFLGGGEVAQRGVRAEVLGKAAGSALREELDSGASLDIHAADQALIYAALAGGSVFRVRELSLHLLTASWLISQFLPVDVLFTPEEKAFRLEFIRKTPATS